MLLPLTGFNPYIYRIERSTNLVHWSLVVAPISRLTDGTAGGLSSLAVFATEAWISLNLRERPSIEYFRAVLLSR